MEEATWGGNVAVPGACTWQRRVAQEGSRGRQSFLMELTAAGKAGAEKMAATKLILRIQDSISSLLLGKGREGKEHWLLTIGPFSPTQHPVPSTSLAQRGHKCRHIDGQRSRGEELDEGRMGRKLPPIPAPRQDLDFHMKIKLPGLEHGPELTGPRAGRPGVIRGSWQLVAPTTSPSTYSPTLRAHLLASHLTHETPISSHRRMGCRGVDRSPYRKTIGLSYTFLPPLLKVKDVSQRLHLPHM